MLLRSRTRDVPGTLWADGITAALAVSAASAALVFETVRDSASGQAMEIAVSLAYPIADLVLLGLIVGALAGTGWQLDRTWVLLAGGVATFWLADSLYLVRTAERDLRVRQLVRDRLVARPGHDRRRRMAARAPRPARSRSTSGCAGSSSRSCFGAGGLGLLVYGAIAGLNPVAVGLAAASLLAVMCRTMLTFRDNVAMLRASRVEALDGRAHRPRQPPRARPRARAGAAARATESDPLVLVLFDLDGFKHYNDTFGHPAGDALLVRLGAGLAGFVEGRGTAYRMGGDEFCALLRPGEPLGHAARRRRGRRALRARRRLRDRLLLRRDPPARARPPTPRRRCGSPTSACTRRRTPAARRPPPVQGRAAARARRAQPGRPPRPRGVADLAEATARQLGLGLEEVEQIRHATELRDVGKVAMPDAILTKPGPLDEDEWAFIRRHTMIGERIIAAAPALTRVAGLVRASHERWDGDGLPGRARGRADPARRPHRRGGRRLRGDDEHRARTRCAAPPRPPSPSSRRAPGRSSTPRSSPPSPSRSATSRSPPRPDREPVSDGFRQAESAFCLTVGKSANSVPREREKRDLCGASGTKGEGGVGRSARRRPGHARQHARPAGAARPGRLRGPHRSRRWRRSPRPPSPATSSSSARRPPSGTPRRSRRGRRRSRRRCSRRASPPTSARTPPSSPTPTSRSTTRS